MNNASQERNALLLIGSPKGLKSTSCALGTYLLNRLEAGGMTTKSLVVGAALHTAKARAEMNEAVAGADLIVVSFPLYVDQLPAPLIETLELIAADRHARPAANPQKIMAIVQCGFPETLQTRPACEIMRRFAKEAGFEWAGALAMGMGGAVGGRPLEKAGGMVRRTVGALNLATASLLAGGNVPREAVDLMAKPITPVWLYVLIANWGMKRQARKHGAKTLIYARPYER